MCRDPKQGIDSSFGSKFRSSDAFFSCHFARQERFDASNTRGSYQLKR